MLKPQALQQPDQTAEQLDQIEDIVKNLLALGEERPTIERRQLEALDTQNLLAWLHYAQATGQGDVRRIEHLVRERLRL